MLNTSLHSKRYRLTIGKIRMLLAAGGAPVPVTQSRERVNRFEKDSV
jgi:hypothetical protein